MEPSPRTVTRSIAPWLIPLCAILLGAGCAFPYVHIAADPHPLLVLPGGRGTVLVRTGTPVCPPQDPRPCVDISGRVFDYVVQNLPPGVTYTVDTSLQSPSTPGVARITFDVAADVAPAVHYVVVIHAVVDGRSVGSRSLPLHVLPANGTVPTSEPIAIAAGEAYSLAALADGSVRAWGENRVGQLGIGHRDDRNVPFAVRNLDGIVAVAAGDEHSLALAANGIVWAWGRNNNGQLGTGFMSDIFGGETTPVQVQGVHNVQAIAVGHEHSLALKADGTVWAWGDNTGGKLGTGDTVGRDLPVQVQSLPRARAIAAGYSFSLAVDVDGFMWIWGTAALADPHAGITRRPIQVAGLNRIQSVVARGGSALALDQDGRLWAWGTNSGGELGDGTMTDRPMPVRIEGPENVVSMALGNYHGLALTAMGAVWAWGGNTVGQLGTGEATTEGRPTPGLVPGLPPVRAIAAGGNHALALVRCGQLWVWGSNYQGQLGNGAGEPSLAPIPLPSLGDDGGCDTVSLRVTLTGDTGVVDNVVTSAAGDLRWNGSEFITFLPRGTGVDLTARADFRLSFGRHFAFDRWAVDCQGIEPQTTVVLDRSKLCAAHFVATSFDGVLLSVINGGGRITSSGGGMLGPAEIECGRDCSAIFPENTVVTLAAENANGFEFTGWSRDCSGTDPQTSVVMSGPRTCEARFRPYELDVSVIGSGTVTSDPTGIDCGDQCRFSPRTGSVVLHATPALGWQLDAWSGDCAGTSLQTSLAIDADKSCTAMFTRTPGFFFLTMVVEGQGSVTSEPAGISCPASCIRLFPAGTIVDLTAQPASLFSLSGWFDDCAAPANSANQVVVDADKQCRVRFAGAPPITVADFTYAPAARVGRLITFDGNASHVFDPVTGNRDFLGITSFAWDFDADGTFEASGGRSAAAVAQYAFQTTGDHTARLRVTGGPFDEVDNAVQVVTVAPAALPLFALAVNKAGGGEGAVETAPPGLIRCDTNCTTAGPLLLESGTMVTLTARARVGSSFAGWSGPACAGTSTSIQVTMTAAVTCTATFTASQPTLTVEINAPAGSLGRIIALQPASSAISCGESGGVCSESFAPGTVVVLQPDSLSLELGRFTGWVGCDSVGPLFSCTVTMSSDRAVVATFSQ